MYLSENTVYKLTFALSIQYLVFCSTYILLYDKAKHQQRFEYNPFEVTTSALKNSLEITLGSTSDKVKNIEALRNFRYFYIKVCSCLNYSKRS